MMGSVYMTPTRFILSLERGDRGARLCRAYSLALCAHDPVSTTLSTTSSRAFQGHTDHRTVAPAAMPDSISNPDRTQVNPGSTPSEPESHTARPEAEHTIPAGKKYSIVCLPSVKTASTLPGPGYLTCTILRDPDDKSEEAKHYAVPMLISDGKGAAIHTEHGKCRYPRPAQGVCLNIPHPTSRAPEVRDFPVHAHRTQR